MRFERQQQQQQQRISNDHLDWHCASLVAAATT